MKPFVRSLIAITALGSGVALSSSAMAEESTGIAQDLLECPKSVQQPRGAAQSEAHGFVQTIDEALAHANLTDEQAEKLSQIGQQVDSQMAAAHQARRDFMLALAQQMASGRIDRQALEPQVQALVNAKNEVSPAIKGALQTIYDTLNPEQRTAFADALEKSIQARVQLHGEKGWLEQWASELNLNEQQKEQIKQIFTQLKPVADQHHQRMNQVLSGFRGQAFNIEQVMPEGDLESEAQQGVERTIAVAQQIAQVLTPQQRQLAARKIVQNVCPKVTPQQGAPYGTSPTGQQQMNLEDENVGTAEDELIIGRRGLWGGYGARYYRGVNRFGTWWPGYGYGYSRGYYGRGFYGGGLYSRGFYGGFYPGYSYAYPYAYSYAYPYSYSYVAPYFNYWPGYSTYAYTFPYISSYSWFW